MFSCLCKCDCCEDGFQNWAGNVKNNLTEIKYPRDDQEIKAILAHAKSTGNVVRVSGSKHSMPPIVCGSSENNITIISLENYNHKPQNLVIDHINCLVNVNAGWKLGALYDELNKYNYFLETQTASSAFSIGGICSMTVHGGRLGGGLVSDGIIAMTLIDENGNDVTKTEKDNDFSLYRLNLGLLGIMTSVTFKMIKVNNLSANVNTHFNIFYDKVTPSKINQLRLNDYFKQCIDKCLNSGNIPPEYRHLFIDYNNQSMVAIEWKDDDKKFIVKEEYPDVHKIDKIVPIDFFLKEIDKDYRKDPTIVNGLGQVSRIAISYYIEKNTKEDRDMFWVESATNVYFMSYFLPVYINGEYQLDNLYKAIEFVMDIVKQYKKDGRNFTVDIPSDLRFVTSSSKSKISPIYSQNKNVYAIMDLVCSVANIHLDSNHVGRSQREINKDFREFFYRVEQKWASLGGKPHWAKVFGFSQIDGDPFSPQSIKALLTPEIRVELQAKAQPLFINQFIKTLLLG